LPIIAKPIPVFPEDASINVLSFVSSPDSSDLFMIFNAILSFIEPPIFCPSNFA